MNFETHIRGNTSELQFDFEQNRVQVDEKEYEFAFERQPNGRHLLRIGTKLYKIDDVSYDKRFVEFTIDGSRCRVAVHDEQDLLMDKMGFKSAGEVGEGRLSAPMPGKILEIMVSEGDQVELGQPVAILEAMKMENELKAPVEGTVSSVSVQAGDSVEKNTLILEIEAVG